MTSLVKLLGTPSKAYDSPVGLVLRSSPYIVLRSKTKMLSFFKSVQKKMCVVSKMENIVKKLICAVKNVRYTKCALYQMYAKLRLNLQR